MTPKKITTPVTAEDVLSLKAGDLVLLTGIIYTARDAAHKLLTESLAAGEDLPLELKGQTIFYTGPAPARPGRVIGPAGPTTSSRMDPYTPALFKAGVKAVIGKGDRSGAVKEALMFYQALYLAAVGGAAVLLSQRIRKQEIVAYAELGPEAVRRLEVEDFPATVVYDAYGGDLYTEGRRRYALEQGE